MKYVVSWLDCNKPVEVEAGSYRTFRSSYERQDVTFYDENHNPVKTISNVHRLQIEIKDEKTVNA